MLHLLNGESIANILKQTGLPGEYLVWREALMTGPAPHGLSPQKWLDLRANHLAEAYERNVNDCRNDWRRQKSSLQEFCNHQEVVLWFEYDLFCQINSGMS